MKEILNYLEVNYKSGEPIFISDIQIEDMSYDNLKQQLKRLTDMGNICRYDKGIYYLPRKSRLKSGFHISAETVAQYKYVSRMGRVMGYYSGHTFANQLGITAQVPTKIEIVSNESSPIVRDIKVGNQFFTVRRSRIDITNENQKTLQLLELLKDFSYYCDIPQEEASLCLQKYIEKYQITRNHIDQYIYLFPDKTYRHIYEMRLENVFAQ